MEDAKSNERPWDAGAGAGELLARIAGSGVIAGLTAGSPASAALGAAAIVLLDAAIAADRRSWSNFDHVATAAIEEAQVSVVELAEWVAGGDDRLQLVGDVIRAAISTLDESKIAALAMVLADGIRDDARMDTCRLVVKTLPALDPVHIRDLEAMIRDANPNNVETRGVAPGGIVMFSAQRWTWGDLFLHLPQYQAGLTNILATLENHGLIGRAPDKFSVYTPVDYALTCLTYLQAKRLH